VLPGVGSLHPKQMAKMAGGHHQDLFIVVALRQFILSPEMTYMVVIIYMAIICLYGYSHRHDEEQLSNLIYKGGQSW
jgi:hypothetical protein